MWPVAESYSECECVDAFCACLYGESSNDEEEYVSPRVCVDDIESRFWALRDDVLPSAEGIEPVNVCKKCGGITMSSGDACDLMKCTCKRVVIDGTTT